MYILLSPESSTVSLGSFTTFLEKTPNNYPTEKPRSLLRGLLFSGVCFLSDNKPFGRKEDKTADTVADYVRCGKGSSEKYGNKAVIGKTYQGNKIEILSDFNKG